MKAGQKTSKEFDGRAPARLARLATLAVATLLAHFPVTAAEPELSEKDLPRLPAIEPRDAINTFRVKRGFHLEFAAAEPMVASPVAMAFDERGRLFVVEMIDYSERRDETPHLGRIRLLEDTNGDGVFDKSSVYADNLPWPTAVFCYDGGVFVGATPDIVYLKDTKGDGKADLQETVFTGFAAGMKKVNVQGMLNSFVWGLDNRIHGATSTDGGLVKSLRHPETPALDLHGRDFAIEPRAMTISSEAGGGQHGLSFDDYGRRFACNNSDHIRLFMYDDRYAARNPFYDMPSPLESIAVDGGAAEVYRISPEEPWRVIRTHWRIAGIVPGMVEGGGRSAGYFTGATGAMIYRGEAFPKNYLGNAFVGDAGGNLVHRKVLYPDDVGLKAQRAADEQRMEFAASTDTWFRPVQFANGPDGALYVIDMYREVIEHPWSLPDNIKKFLDLNSGNNRGRIYRVVPDGFKRPPAPKLDKAAPQELFAALQSPNGWTRDTASRLIYERREISDAPALAEIAANPKFPLGRLHALHALDGLGSLQASNVLRAMDDPNTWVRVHAVRLSEQFATNAEAAGPLMRKLQRLAADPANVVRYQVAFTVGEFPFSEEEKTATLAEIVRRDPGSRWIQAAVLSSLSSGAGRMFSALTGDIQFGATRPGREFLRQLARLVGAIHDPKATAALLDYAGKSDDLELSFGLARSLGEGLKQAKSSLLEGDSTGAAKAVIARANEAAVSGQLPEPTRIEAIGLLGLTDDATASQALLSLLAPDQPEPVQLAAVATLARIASPGFPAEFLARWKSYSPRVKSEVLAALLAQPARATALLRAIADSAVPRTDLTTAQLDFLRSHRNANVKELAVKILGAANPNEREEAINTFQPSLSLRGDAAKGREIYSQRCVSCHRSAGAGFALGPDFVTVKNTGKEKLLVNILDPSREVAPQYIAFEVDTKDGESLLGVIANETTSTLTVRQAYAKETVVPRSNIKAMRSQGKSLMPDGLEQGLSPQDFANLLEYISTADAK